MSEHSYTATTLFIHKNRHFRGQNCISDHFVHKTPDFVDKTLKERIFSTKTPYFVDKTESTGISYIIP